MKSSNLLWILIILIIVVNIVGYIVPWGNEQTLQIFSDALPILCSFISVICLFVAYRSFKEKDNTKKAWLMFLLGVFMFFLAETIYFILEFVFKTDMNETFPSIADLFWIGGYFPMLIGLSMMYFGYKKSGLPMGDYKIHIIFSLFFLMMIFIIIQFLLSPIIADDETRLIQKICYIYYPVADLVLVVPAVMLMYITSLFGSGMLSKPWRFLSAGFMFITFADLFYSYLGWRDLYSSGNLIDVAWHSGYLILGMAGLCQKEILDTLKKV